MEHMTEPDAVRCIW